MHRDRRRRALALLAGLSHVRSVLFVCHGNICRSPYAAFAFARALPPSVRDHVTISSAGFVGPDRPPPTEALSVARSRGIDMSAHRSSLLTASTVQNTDLVVVMDERQRRAIAATYPSRAIVILGDLDPAPIDTRGIRDPWAQSEDVFEQSYARIDLCIDSMVEALYPFGTAPAIRSSKQHARG